MRALLPVALVLGVVAGCFGGAPRVSPEASESGGLPSVTIQSPQSGAAVAPGQALKVSIRGEDVRGVSRLDLRVDDVLVDSASTPNASAQSVFEAILEWTPSAEGTVTISALAYRPTGTGSLPASIQVVVGDGVPAEAPATDSFSSPSWPPIGVGPTPPTAVGGEETAEPTRAPRPTPPPPPRRQPRAQASPTPEPTRRPRRTETPAPTPRPTREPTPRPTREPTPPPEPARGQINLRVAVRDRHIPNPWPADTEVNLRVFVQNMGTAPSPRFALRGQVGNSELGRVEVERGAIAPGETQRFTIPIPGSDPGDRRLRVEARVLGNANDADPEDNTFLTRVPVGRAAAGP